MICISPRAFISAALILALTTPGYAVSNRRLRRPSKNEATAQIPLESPPRHRVFDLGLKREPDRERNTIFPPLVSFFLPGFDQWWEGQTTSAGIYTAFGLSGLALMATANPTTLSDQSAAAQLDTRDNSIRQYLLGSQILMTAGELSAYHSFRSAVRTHQAHGEYAFLPKESEEDTGDLLLAPFHFSYLSRPTAFIPLGILAAALVASYGASQHGLDLADFFYSSASSYNAGVGEEALFRGWIMPRLMYSFDNEFLSNLSQALVFGAAHIATDNTIPWPQALLGMYFGWVDQRHEWTISESVFIHAWWDAMLIVYDASLRSQARPLMVPLVSGTF